MTNQTKPHRVIVSRGRKLEGEADGDQPTEGTPPNPSRGYLSSRGIGPDRWATAGELRPQPGGNGVCRSRAPAWTDGLGRLPPDPPEPPGRRRRFPGHLS